MRRPPNLMKSAPTQPPPPPAAAAGAPTNYLDLYGLSKPPFGTEREDPAFILFGSRRRPFELLVDHLVNGSGVVLLVGEEGTGKTETLRSAGIVAAESGATIIPVSRPAGGRVSPETLAAALEDLRTTPTPEPPRKAALIDDIDLLSDDSLGLLLAEAKREAAETPPCPIVLACPESALTKPGIREIAGLARNTVRLIRLNSSEAQQYIERSLWIAGGTTRRLVTPDALKLLIARSNGIPATINRMMEATFNAGFARGDSTITARTVAAAVGPIATRRVPRVPPARGPDQGIGGRVMQFAAIGLLVTGAAIFLYRGLTEPVPPPAAPRPEVTTPDKQPAATAPMDKPPIIRAPEPMSPDLMAALIKRGNESLDLGDVAAARLLFQRAAEAGNAAAATALGKTYDPREPRKAAEWYAKAVSLGDSEAAGLLKRLDSRPKSGT
jgi:type II secretory pathway predicted ATPase ExeA